MELGGPPSSTSLIMATSHRLAYQWLAHIRGGCNPCTAWHARTRSTSDAGFTMPGRLHYVDCSQSTAVRTHNPKGQQPASLLVPSLPHLVHCLHPHHSILQDPHGRLRVHAPGIVRA